MTSIRQFEANRRNAQSSTGPTTEEGKLRSRQNAVRHGLTAETVIGALEDAEDYAAFELNITSEYDAQTAVERELVLRLASVLWRLRRATLIETGLFADQATRLLQDSKNSPTRRFGFQIGTKSQRAREMDNDEQPVSNLPNGCSDDLTRSYVQLMALPNCPLDRLSRYEAALWRQAGQIIFTLQCLDRRKPSRRYHRL
jgi:hypothetical protein